MMLQRIVRPLQQNRGSVNDMAVHLLRTLTHDWTPAYLSLLIDADTVPKKHIDTIVDYLGKHPAFLTIQKEQFLAAARIARPDLHALLITPRGDRWLEHAMADLGKALLVRSVQWLFQGGK